MVMREAATGGVQCLTERFRDEKGKVWPPFNQPLALGISGEGVRYAGRLPGLIP